MKKIPPAKGLAPNQCKTVFAGKFYDILIYILRRASALLARKGVELLSGLLTIAILARTLSKDQFAVYSLVMSFVAILRLSAFPGLGGAVTQAFARGKGEIFAVRYFCLWQAEWPAQ